MSFDTSDELSNRETAKRNLFGRVDHDQTRSDLQRQLRSDGEEKKRQWNFDFENCEPLPGRYKWQRVGKRLQARKSPTETTPRNSSTGASFVENIFPDRTADSTRAEARYNLRKRGRGLENFAGLEFDYSRNSLCEFRSTTAAAGKRNTGEYMCINSGVWLCSQDVQLKFCFSFLGNYESKRIAKERKPRSTLTNIRRKSKIPDHLATRRTR